MNSVIIRMIKVKLFTYFIQKNNLLYLSQLENLIVLFFIVEDDMPPYKDDSFVDTQISIAKIFFHSYLNLLKLEFVDYLNLNQTVIRSSQT